MAGVFIDVEMTDEVRNDPELAKKLEEGCPVDIYAARNGHTEVVEENLDECILCEICVRTAPPGTLKVLKLYDGTALESQ